MSLTKESKAWLVQQLRDWRETFDNEGDEEGHKEIGKLISKIRAGKIIKADWENIMFHLWQKLGFE
jgi:hypothetical protein